MSRRSYHSLQQEKRLTKHRVTDEDLFECAMTISLHVCHSNCLLQLCFACCVSPTLRDHSYPNQLIHNPSDRLLAHLTQPKVTEPKPPGMDLRDREHSSRLSVLSNFSIGDIFRDVSGGGSKSTKFPEKLVKVLEQKLQDVALGKDAMSEVFHVIFCSDVRLLPEIGILTSLFGARWPNSMANS